MLTDEDYRDIGKRIAKLRENRNMTQSDLASAAEFSIQHISNIERGHTKLALSALIKLSNALEVSPDVILCDTVYSSKAIFKDELSELIESADENEIKIMVSLFKTLIPTLRRYYNKDNVEQ